MRFDVRIRALYLLRRALVGVRRVWRFFWPERYDQGGW